MHSTTALNPSFLSKGAYGTINLAPASVGAPKDRLKVEVTRLTTPASAVAAGDKPAATAAL